MVKSAKLALSVDANSVFYIEEGVVPKFGFLFDTTLFRRHFETKGRFATYLSDKPVWLIIAEQSHALEGAANVANELS